MKHLLEEKLNAKVGLVGTNGNMIGDELIHTERTTPESFELQQLFREMADAGCTHVVLEASSHALVQHRLEGLIFQVGVFTNLTQDHLDYHGTMEDYRIAKGLLFRQCRRGVLNLDDEAGRWYLQHISCPAFTYSERRDEAHLTAHNLQVYPDRVEFEAVTLDQIAHIQLPIPGGFSIYNALAALSAGMCLGLSLGEMAPVLAGVKGVKGRVEIVPVPAPYTVIIDYAHTPDGLKNILAAVCGFAEGRVIAVFGCGGDRDKTKRPRMGRIAAALSDFAVLASDNPRTEDPYAILREVYSGMADAKTPFAVIEDRREAIRFALRSARRGDVVVLCGKGHETYQIIGTTKYPLDEREVVRACFAKEQRKDAE